MRLMLALAALLTMASPSLAAPYALVVEGSILEWRDFADTPPDLARKGVAWLPVEITDPPFDPATQVRSGPVTTVEADRVSRVWTVRAKTAAEIDADKTLQIDGLDVAVFRALCNHENRIRALETKAAMTIAQCKTAFKSLIP